MQHPVLLLHWLLAAAAIFSSAMAVQSDSEESCSGPESTTWNARMNGQHGHFPGTCKRATQTCHYTLKHGMWGSMLWIDGDWIDDEDVYLHQPIPPGKHAWHSKQCDPRYKCQNDGDLCVDRGSVRCHYPYGLKDLKWNIDWNSDSESIYSSEEEGPPSEASRSWRSSKRKSSGGSRSSSKSTGSTSSSRSS